MTRAMHGSINTCPPAITAGPGNRPSQNGTSRTMNGTYIAPAISAMLGQL